MQLDNQQRKKLQKALIDAFPAKSKLEQLLSLELNKNLNATVGVGSLQDVVFELIQTANSQGWVEDLVRAALNENSGNPLLKAIAEELLSSKTDTILPTNPQKPSYQPQKINNKLVITPERYRRLRHALLNCDQFESSQRLRNFFKVHAALAPWQYLLPQASSLSELVEVTIGYLNDKYRSDTKENALVILLHLLAESIEPDDRRHQTLFELAQELENSL